MKLLNCTLLLTIMHDRWAILCYPIILSYPYLVGKCRRLDKYKIDPSIMWKVGYICVLLDVLRNTLECTTQHMCTMYNIAHVYNVAHVAHMYNIAHVYNVQRRTYVQCTMQHMCTMYIYMLCTCVQCTYTCVHYTIQSLYIIHILLYSFVCMCSKVCMYISTSIYYTL